MIGADRCRYVSICLAAGLALSCCAQLPFDSLRSLRTDSALPPTEAAAPSREEVPPLVNVIHWFVGDHGRFPDGYGPSGLTPYKGSLYGTAAFGGRYANGTVFKISPSGAIHVIYSFGLSPDGNGPGGRLVPINGAFYGTTVQGGDYGAGTVYRLTPSGSEQVLHSFAGGTDGALPSGDLTLLRGKLYGTTSSGGDRDLDGVVYEITTSGRERVTYHFHLGHPVVPTDLVAVGGELYGITLGGGNGLGAIFELTPNGAFRSLHTFSDYDGGSAAGGLTPFKGTLLCTTGGIVDEHGLWRNGTVFELRPPSGFHVIVRVGDGHGGGPEGGVTPLAGAFYIVSGGGYRYGDGGVFEITAAGSRRLIALFRKNPDGRNPGGLEAFDGKLDGTMFWGGHSPSGGGTIFTVN